MGSSGPCTEAATAGCITEAASARPAQRQPQPWWEQLEPPQANAQVDTQDIHKGLLTILYEKIENLEKKMLMKGDLIDNLHLTVPAEIRQKIWAGNYVDLSTLLIKNYQKLD